MFKCQFGTLAIAISLLLPSVATANEAIAFTDLSVGEIQITTSDRGTLITTPNIFIAAPTPTDYRAPSSKRNAVSKIITRPQIEIDDDDDDLPVVTRSSAYRTFSIPSIPQIPFVRSFPTMRNYTVRTTSVGRDSYTDQQQSVSCSGGGTVTQSTSTTINGRTVKTQFQSKCK
jgi:hypothetical protein